MPRVTTAKAEIEFTAGTWTDVSTDVDWAVGWSYQVGRTTPQGVAQTSTLSLTLYNTTGKYTPGLQTLSDGTAAPYYPNVVTRKRLRVSINGTVRFLGYIKGWYPQLVNGVLGKVVVQAADLFDALGRMTLQGPMVQAVNVIAPTYYWPLGEASGSAAAAEQSGGPALTITGSTPALSFGDVGAAGGGSGVKFAPTTFSNGQHLQGTIPALTGAFSLAIAFNANIPVPAWYAVPAGTGEGMISLDDSGSNVRGVLRIINNGGVNQIEYADLSGNIAGAFTPDGAWHFALITRSSSGGAVSLYLDNVLIGNSGASSPVGPTILIVGTNTNSADAFLGNLAHLVLLTGAEFTPAQRTTLYNAVNGFNGETTDTRIARYLGYAGLTSASWNLDASTVPLGTYDSTAKDVVAASQDATGSENGGAVFYVNAGLATFKNRTARKPGAPTLTLDAVRDLDRDVWQPSNDDSTQLNQVTVQRGSTYGVASTQTIDKSAGGQVLNETFTTYTATDADALNTAQSRLAQNLTPGFRLPQVSVDLVTAENNLYSAAFAVGIGSRIRVASIPTGMAPATRVDSIVEGWNEAYSVQNGVESYRFTFDTSSADNPAWFVWDDAAYGRWQCSGQTLNAGITAVATTLAIATTAGNPTFTTAGAMYPLTIQVGAEQITLNSAPGGSSSPQTFTGVTRGVNGTTAGAQAGGAAVDLAPASTWTL